MINLEVADYCQNCPEFDPCCDVVEHHYFTSIYEDEDCQRTITVKCAHESRCNCISQMLIGELRKELGVKLDAKTCNRDTGMA